MDSIFDDGFDMEDATVVGGIMGFAEESVREENQQPDEIDEEPEEEIPAGPSASVVMRLLRNENPGLFAHVVRLVLAHKAKWAEARMQRRQDSLDLSGVRHELDAIERTERLIKEDDEI